MSRTMVNCDCHKHCCGSGTGQRQSIASRYRCSAVSKCCNSQRPMIDTTLPTFTTAVTPTGCQRSCTAAETLDQCRPAWWSMRDDCRALRRIFLCQHLSCVVNVACSYYERSMVRFPDRDFWCALRFQREVRGMAEAAIPRLWCTSASWQGASQEHDAIHYYGCAVISRNLSRLDQ